MKFRMNIMIVVIICLLGFLACEPVGVMELKEGVKYHLSEWPDSLYMANLEAYSDTLNKVEKKKWTAQSKIKMNYGDFEEIDMSREEFKKRFGRYPSSSKKNGGNIEKTPDNLGNIAKTKDTSSEKFLESFSNKMEAIRKDPNNNSLYKNYIVTNEQSISAVLIKVYGKHASQIPSVLVKYQLKSFNSAINFDDLHSGDKIKIPKI